VAQARKALSPPIRRFTVETEKVDKRDNPDVSGRASQKDRARLGPHGRNGPLGPELETKRPDSQGYPRTGERARSMDYRPVPLDTLRELARERSERTSLRQVAAAVGVGRTTLQKFIQGETSPHPRVKRALARWYHQETERSAEDAAADEYGDALEVLVGGLPAEPREQARAALVDLLERFHVLLGVPLPSGLAGLRDRLAGEPGS
jgi:transcriptional regulator with XRE-family HTH domain